MPSGTGLVHFAKRASRQRYFDVGIAEEHAALFACGLADAGLQAVPRDLLHLHAARLRHDHPRHRAAKSERRALHGSRRPERRRRPDAPRPLRHRLPAATCPNSSTCSRRTKTNSSTCSGRWRTTTPARSPSATRAASAPARSPKQQPKLLEIGKAEVVKHGTRSVAIFGLGNMFEMAARSRGQAGRARHLDRRDQPALDQAARHRHDRILRAQRGSRLHHRGPRPAQRLRLRRHGAPRRRNASTRRSSASAGPTNSSSTAAVPILRKKHGLTAEAAVEKILAALPARKGIQVKPAAA